ncbi:MAG: polysaccharide biosynthesis/export family protein [Candidatus Omnitrophota bacterium]
MKLIRTVTWVAVVLIFCLCQYGYSAEVEKGPPDIGEVRIIRAADIEVKEWSLENYRIETGDVLEISVWQVEDLQKEVVVRPDGKVSFPLVGDVEAAGYTIDEMAKDITDKLKTYIKSPQVSIIVNSFGGKKLIVLGEVGSTGIIRFTEPIRIMEALALSGGYLESAGLQNVLIIRGDLKGKTDVIVVNVKDILKGNLRENIYVEKDDIIFLPRSFIGNVAYFVRQISPLLGAATTYYNIKETQYNFKNKDYRTTTTSSD